MFMDAAAPLQDLPCGSLNKNVMSTYLVLNQFCLLSFTQELKTHPNA